MAIEKDLFTDSFQKDQDFNKHLNYLNQIADQLTDEQRVEAEI